MVITQNNSWYKKFLISEQWRAVDNTCNIVRNGSHIVFEKKVISSQSIWIDFQTSAEVSAESKHLKPHNLCDKGIFTKVLKVCYFMHTMYVEIPSEKVGLWHLPKGV